VLLSKINLNHLVVFQRVYEAKSMTKAAELLFMTQSGVSQHMKSLEDFLGVKLFDRVKQRPIPTHHADVLFGACLKSFTGLEEVLMQITGEEDFFHGEVRIGLPLDFGNNLVLPILAQLGAKHVNLSFKIKYGHAGEMNQLLLKGEIDFAFIDDFSVDKQINTEIVAIELLVLCAGEKYMHSLKVKPSNSEKFFSQLDYVDYVEGAPVLKLWFKHHFDHELPVRIRASLMDVQGMGRIITEGLGAGILPLHVVNRLEDVGQKIHIFKGSSSPLENHISLAFLNDRTFSKTVYGVRDHIVKSLKQVAPLSSK